MFGVALLAGRRAGRRRPSTIVRAGFVLLAAATVLLIPLVPVADSGWALAIPLALAGAGLGLLASQLNNYALAPISEERVGEAAGVTSATGSFGLSFGLAFTGAIMLATLSIAFTSMAESSDVLPPSDQQQVAEVLEDDAQVMSDAQLEELLVGQPEAVQDEILSDQHRRAASRPPGRAPRDAPRLARRRRQRVPHGAPPGARAHRSGAKARCWAERRLGERRHERRVEGPAQPLDRLGHEPVVRPRAAPLGLDEACLAQEPEVVRDRRLGEGERLGEVADAARLAGREPVHDRDAGRVGERLEDARQLRRRARRPSRACRGRSRGAGGRAASSLTIINVSATVLHRCLSMKGGAMAIEPASCCEPGDDCCDGDDCC